MADIPKPENRPTIMIVDDDRLMQTAFADALNEAGFMTVCAPDGESALATFVSQPPGLMLLDLVLPGMDGFQTCEKVRALPKGKYTPVLMVTGSDEEEVVNRAFTAGATDFIAKPVNPRLLVNRIRYVLRATENLLELGKDKTRLAITQQIARIADWEWNPLTGTFWISDEVSRIAGMEQDSSFATFTDFLGVLHGPDREMVKTELERAYVNRSTCALEFRIRHASAGLRFVRLHGQLHEMVFGETVSMVGTLQDITEIRHAENRLFMLKQAVDCLPVGITLADIKGRIIYSNPAEAKMHGYTVDELIGAKANCFAHPSQNKPYTPEQFDRFGVWRRESMNIRKNGEEFPVHLTSVAVRNPRGAQLGMVTICDDITSKKNAEAHMHRLAYYDTLTGLPNRRLFLDQLHQALALAKREGRKAGLIFLDLDNFKDVNDIHGHDFGDMLLREVTARLSLVMRESDTFARFGGDEFVIILSSIQGHESAAMVAERIGSVFVEPFSMEGHLIFSNASIGIAIYPDDGADKESLLKSADTAMYYAKNEGRSCYRFFSADMNQQIIRRVALEKGLRSGLENNEFFLHYQPQWDLQTAAMSGFEVLLRWRSADFGLMPPSEFIALTEDTGLIIDLGEWVLRSACLQTQNWWQAGHQGLKVAVNISGQQMRQPNFLKMVEGIIRETAIDPALLELEITESVIMENAEKTISILKGLKEMGILLSIDDFGTGYSSLSYLRNFPIDRIKIDRSFITCVNSVTADTKIVEAIISLARSLGLKVVAEGVENEEQLQFLHRRGCDEVQGFYLSKPMHAAELADILGQRHEKILLELGLL